MSDSPHPLQSVPLVGATADGSPTASAAAVSGFQSAAAETQSGAAQSAVDDILGDEPDAEEIEQPQLDDVERVALQHFRALVERNQLDAGILAAETEELRILHDRNRQLEARLVPMRLHDLLLRKYLSQDIPVVEASGRPGDPDYEAGFLLIYRTISSTIELDAGEVSRELAKDWPEEGEIAINQNFLLQVATLACGLQAIDGKAQASDSIHSSVDIGERRRLLTEATRELMGNPIPLLNELFSHQRMFTARVRKLLSHAGYVRQEVGNS